MLRNITNITDYFRYRIKRDEAQQAPSSNGEATPKSVESSKKVCAATALFI